MHDDDEREDYLSKKAFGISYLLLVIILGVILFVTEKTGMLTELKNIPLVTCFSLSIVFYPLVQAVTFLKQKMMWKVGDMDVK